MDEILGAAVSGIGAGPLGAITGLLGGLASKVFGWLEAGRKIELARVNNEHQLALVNAENDHDRKMAEMKFADRAAERESEERIVATQADAANMQASYRHDASYGTVYRWAATVLRLVRPVLTIMLIYMYYRIFIMVEQAGRIEDATAMVNGVIYATTTAVAWWFADRGPQGNNLRR